MKEYIIHDIGSMVLLEDLGVFKQIRNSCKSITVSDYRILNYSTVIKRKVEGMIGESVYLAEVDGEFDGFIQSSNSTFSMLGLGDISSLYLASAFNSTLVTNSSITYSIAEAMSIDVVKTKDFVYQKLENNDVKLIINQLIKDDEIDYN